MVLGLQNLIVSSLSILATIYTEKYEEIDKGRAFPENPTIGEFLEIKEYDFIIVGGGSAGGTLANRLSENFSILLIEAGGDPIPQTYIPVNYAYTIEDPTVMHVWETQPQRYSALDDGGVSKMGQGRFLGGSSVVNGLNYNRGHPKDYDNWANYTGDESWNYQNLLPLFKMTEGFQEEDNVEGHMGVGGPLVIQKGGVEFKETYEAFMNAGEELGYKRFINSNAPQTEGVGPISSTLQLGRRVSVYDAFIKPILRRQTLTVSRYSKVSKVDIDENNRAIGVFYTQHGVQRYAKAKLEVILSAGSMNSPMILLRSGIGPKKQLEEFQIPVKMDLPVGENFQDHPISVICSHFDDPSKFPMHNDTQKYVEEYVKNGTGPLTLIGGGFADGFFVSTQAKLKKEFDWPDIKFGVKLSSTLYSPQGNNALCILVILVRGCSKGSISLNPKDPIAPGIWDPNWLKEPEDVKILGEGLKIAASFLDSNSMKNYGVTLDKTSHPACSHLEFGSDEYWQCFSRWGTKTCWHAVGTCKMGKVDDVTSVVDSKLRVKGIQGLRVIDNSIQPTITNANTLAPAILIAQKGADMILEVYKKTQKIKTEL